MFNKKIIEIKIDGMHCEHCANKVKDILEEKNDIKNVKLDLKKGIAKLKVEDKNIDLKDIENSINELGYEYKGLVG